MINWLKTNNRWQAVAGLLLLLGAYALGRYVAPTKTITKTVTVEVEKTKTHEDKVIVERIEKDGTKTTTTHVVTNTETDKKANTKQEQIVENKKSSLLVSALGGVDITKPNGLIFGAHVSRQTLGPVHIGLFGLTNGTIGASVGLQF